MKKIGILFGQERSFPMAFVERINSKNIPGIMAEPVRIDKVMQGEASGYAVIIDRISQDVPFYRAFLKNAALCGTAVINNPFWWSADENFSIIVSQPRSMFLFLKQSSYHREIFRQILPINLLATSLIRSIGKESSTM